MKPCFSTWISVLLASLAIFATQSLWAKEGEKVAQAEEVIEAIAEAAFISPPG